MSVDIESWVHRQVFNIPLSEQTKELDSGHVLRSSRIILDLFRKYHTKATFFVLGTVAEWYPELIEEIISDGHEIGVHGYTHTRIMHHTRESFDAEIKKTLSILNTMGVRPSGYRSPAFSKADFLYEVLKENGFTYDSSILPVKTPLYDGSRHDCRPFITELGIVEIPCSALKIAKLRIPVGGFYLRLFGSRLNYLLLKKIEQRYGIAVMYFHPWEILDIPEKIFTGKGEGIRLSFLKRKFAYYKIPAFRELEYLLGKINFTNIQEAGSYINQTLNIYERSK